MSCPICASASDPKYRPFCSRRCADADLAKWLNGAYALPSQDQDDVADALEAAALSALKDPPKPH